MLYLFVFAHVFFPKPVLTFVGHALVFNKPYAG